MIISFFGHRRCYGFPLKKDIINTIFENIDPNEKILFYCGGYGEFDSICLRACSEIKTILPDAEIILVTPYITEASQKSIHKLLEFKDYDSVIYPPLERVPYKLAILKRNEWIVSSSDFIVFYVNNGYGGAYESLKYAIKKNKKYINLGNYFLDKKSTLG